MLEKSEIIFVLKNLIAPLRLPIININFFRTPEFHTSDEIMALIKKFFKDFPYTTNINQNSIELIIQEVTFYIGYKNVNPVVIDHIGSFPDFTVPSFNAVSGLSIYKINKKLTWFISQYLLYTFSIYLNTEHPNVSLNVINKLVPEFVTKNTIVKQHVIDRVGSDFMAGLNPIPKIFTERPNPILDKNNRIIIPEDDHLQTKLIYFLRLKLNQNNKNVLEFHNRIVTENYIKNISDFQLHDSQIVIEGLDNMNLYIETMNIILSGSRHVKNILSPKIKC